MSHDHSHVHLFPGVPLALGSALLFGTTPLAAKLLLADLSPVLLAGLLYLGAGLGLLVLHLARGGGTETPLSRTDLPWLAGAILSGGVIGPVLLMFGLSFTSASNGALLLNLESLATMAIAWLVFRENVDRRLLLGAAAIVAGAVLLSWHGEGAKVDWGAALVAAACLAWGIDNNLTRKIAAANPVQIALWKGLAAGCVNLAIAAALGAAVPAALPAGLAGLVGFLGIGVSLVMFIMALRHLGTARTGAYYSLAPFAGAVLAVVVLQEPLTLRLLLAGALMALGLWLHLSERHVHEHSHEALEHDHAHVHDEHHQHGHDGPVREPHAHRHVHAPLRHAHVHYPDLHHRHGHETTGRPS
jgi:drug/metabolite transporter (DMT)-like permease